MNDPFAQVKRIADAVSGGIQGWLGGVDGGANAAPDIRTEQIPQDQSDPSQLDNTSSGGMKTSTMIMIGAAVVAVVGVVALAKSS